MQIAGEEAEIERDAEQRQARDQHAGDGAGLEGELQTAGQRLGGGLRDADVGAHRHIHADEAGCPRQNGADGKAERHQPAERNADQDEDHHADDADGGVLALEIGLRAFAHRRGNLLHLRAAGIGAQHRTGGPDAIENREHATADDHPQINHGRSTFDFDWCGRNERSRRYQERRGWPLYKGASPRPGKRADIAKKRRPVQRGSFLSLPRLRGRDKKVDMRHHPYSLRRRVRRRPRLRPSGFGGQAFSPSNKSRGRSAERRILSNPRLAARAPVTTGARLSALHRGVLTAAPGRAFGVRFVLPCGSKLAAPFGSTAHTEPRASLNGPPSASSWQGSLVTPGGAPAPPGCRGCVSSPARGRRIRSRQHHAS